MNKYTYSFNVKCPNDEHGFIYYTAVIEIEKMIMVEDIIEYCDLYKKEFHENIADDLINKFGGKQTITATHKNVKIETIRNENEVRWCVK